MWIRTQDRLQLMKINGVWTYDKRIHASDTGGTIGKYATDKRCLEVLDEIQMAIISGKKAFLMPEE